MDEYINIVTGLLYNKLRKFGRHISRREIKENILCHPYSYEIQAISDFFKDVGIDNVGVRLKTDQVEEVLNQAHIMVFLQRDNRHYPVWVEQINKDTIRYTDYANRIHT